MRKKLLALALSIFIFISVLFTGCIENQEIYTLSNLPEYSGEAYVELNNNEPYFTSEEMVTVSFETYGELDSLGRCTEAYACVGQDLMPTEERGSISSIKPSGWQTAKYDNISGKYLYNRCHLIGWQLTGENANKNNLITGTRYLNIEGMLPFENMVDDYVDETNNHVLYRVTPIFQGKNLVASGVQMEGYSVEDEGKGISFNVYLYNVQPGIDIYYKTGESALEGKLNISTEYTTSQNYYVLNINSQKIHTPSCSSVKNMREENKKVYNGEINSLVKKGYTLCKSCNPE